MGIRWKAVTQQELCFTTGELAEYRRKEDGERQELQQIPQTPAMAMGGIAGKRLDQLLNALNREQIDLPVKMVITPHNESWVFGELIEEVRKEHELFLAMERLKRLSMRAQTLENEEAQQLVKLAKDALARMRGREDRKPGRPPGKSVLNKKASEYSDAFFDGIKTSEKVFLQDNMPRWRLPVYLRKSENGCCGKNVGF